MGRKRRDRGNSGGDLLGNLQTNFQDEPASEVTASDIANQAYGSNVGFGGKSKTIRAKSIDLSRIQPDVMQPRRAVPFRLRQYWNGTSEGVHQLMTMWLREIEIERGRPFDVMSYLLSQSTDRAPMDIREDELEQVASSGLGALEAVLMPIVDLATSIKRDGLTNPISVVAQGDGFVIETGERRWLAYHVLDMFFSDDDSDWSKIPARIVDERNIWRQASENNTRQDLNAIAKARQFSLLLMDLYGFDRFSALQDFANERDFYAQVVDSQAFRVPYGKGEMVLNAMGFEHKSALVRHRQLLMLSPEAWMLADDLNCPEGVLRSVVQADSNTHVSMIESWANTGKVANGNHSVATKSASKDYSFRAFLHKESEKLYKRIGQMSGDDRRKMSDYLRELADQIDNE